MGLPPFMLLSGEEYAEHFHGDALPLTLWDPVDATAVWANLLLAGGGWVKGDDEQEKLATNTRGLGEGCFSKRASSSKPLPRLTPKVAAIIRKPACVAPGYRYVTVLARFAESSQLLPWITTAPLRRWRFTTGPWW